MVVEDSICRITPYGYGTDQVEASTGCCASFLCPIVGITDLQHADIVKKGGIIQLPEFILGRTSVSL